MSRLRPADIANVDQATSQAQEVLDTLCEAMKLGVAKNGASASLLDFGAMLARWPHQNVAGLLSLAVQRLNEADRRVSDER